MTMTAITKIAMVEMLTVLIDEYNDGNYGRGKDKENDGHDMF